MILTRRNVMAGGIAAATSVLVPRWSFGQAGSGPVVETAQGKARGIVAANGINVFKGLRYAASSAGPLRFLPPAPPPKWAGVQDAFEYGDQSPQARGSLAAAQAMSDDCMRINVWTPALDNAKRPVMLWFHGGGFEAGSGSSRLYDGTRVARRGDVVIATINHRLNVFGHC